MLHYFQVTYICWSHIYFMLQNFAKNTYTYCSPWHMLFKESHIMHKLFLCLQYAWTNVIARHGSEKLAEFWKIPRGCSTFLQPQVEILKNHTRTLTRKLAQKMAKMHFCYGLPPWPSASVTYRQTG